MKQFNIKGFQISINKNKQCIYLILDKYILLDFPDNFLLKVNRGNGTKLLWMETTEKRYMDSLLPIAKINYERIVDNQEQLTKILI